MPTKEVLTFITEIRDFADNPTWGTHFPVPVSIAEKFIGTDRRILLQINDRPEMHCALMPGGNNTWFINATKALRKEMQLDIGDEVTLTIRKDDSKYGMELPEEMAELWKIDERGADIFHSLSMGKQRTLLHLVAKPKGSATRLKKALMINDYLKSVNGDLDFKELNLWFKENKSHY